MDPRVRNLLKRVVVLSRQCGPEQSELLLDRTRKELAKHRNLTSEADIKTAVGRGRWLLQEQAAVLQLHKYRTIGKRYGYFDETPASASGPGHEDAQAQGQGQGQGQAQRRVAEEGPGSETPHARPPTK